MKIFSKIMIGLLVVLIVAPFFFPKYPEYEDVSIAYDWGQIKTDTYAYLGDHKSNTGSIDIVVAFHPNSSTNDKCVLELSYFKAELRPGEVLEGESWTGATIDYWNENIKRKRSVFISSVVWPDEQLSDIDISLKVKTGEHCGAENSVITIDETLKLKMLHHTLWDFLFDVLMSV